MMLRLLFLRRGFVAYVYWKVYYITIEEDRLLMYVSKNLSLCVCGPLGLPGVCDERLSDW